MAHQLWAKSGTQLLEVHTSRTQEGLSEVTYASWSCAFVPDHQVSETKQFIASLMAEVMQWPEYDELKRTLADRNRVVDAIRDELATITLRRVLPGRCRYCPI